MVVALPSGRVVFARNADLSLEPASNEKLSVTYAALVELGANYRFPTELLGQGRRVGDTWEGTADPQGLRRSEPHLERPAAGSRTSSGAKGSATSRAASRATSRRSIRSEPRRAGSRRLPGTSRRRFGPDRRPRRRRQAASSPIRRSQPPGASTSSCTSAGSRPGARSPQGGPAGRDPRDDLLGPALEDPPVHGSLERQLHRRDGPEGDRPARRRARHHGRRGRRSCGATCARPACRSQGCTSPTARAFPATTA